MKPLPYGNILAAENKEKHSHTEEYLSVTFPPMSLTPQPTLCAVKREKKRDFMSLKKQSFSCNYALNTFSSGESVCYAAPTLACKFANFLSLSFSLSSPWCHHHHHSIQAVIWLSHHGMRQVLYCQLCIGMQPAPVAVVVCAHVV